MVDLFRGLITNEGISKVRDIVSTGGWKIAPYQFSFTSSPQGEFSATRTTTSMQNVWHTGYFSDISKLDNNKILLTISLDGSEYGVAREITEIYVTATLTGGTPFLYALIQPVMDLTYQPGVGMEMSFVLTLTNTNKADIYTIEYADISKLGNYQLKREKGQPNGYAPLGANSIVPDNYLPLRDNLPLGTIVPIMCSASYIPSGYLPCNGLEYTYSQFSSFYTEYLLKNLVPSCTYQEYQAEINSYGSCNKFALDTARATFKTPTIADGAIIQQALTDSNLNKSFNNGVSDNQGKSIALRHFVIVTHGLINTSITDWSVWVNTLQLLNNAIDIGRPVISLSNYLPEGFIFLEGATISRTTYSKLFSIYGTTYGEGDGSTTFTLPDFRNKTVWGANSFGYIGAGLPNIYGEVGDAPAAYVLSHSSGAFTRSNIPAAYGYNYGSGGSWRAYFDASRSNSIYGASDTVQPPSIKVRVITRYK